MIIALKLKWWLGLEITQGIIKIIRCVKQKVVPFSGLHFVEQSKIIIFFSEE